MGGTARIRLFVVSTDPPYRRRDPDLGTREMGEHTSRSAPAYGDVRNAAGEPVASALYVYELRAGQDRSVRRMLLMK